LQRAGNSKIEFEFELDFRDPSPLPANVKREGISASTIELSDFLIISIS
jgi:hypothetical protein